MPVQGIINVCKPPGMTSHDVVDAVRRLCGTRRVGHTGTLDPLAAGVLVVCVGRATRLAELLADADKAYRAEATFGIQTDTLDAEGQVVARADASQLTEARVRQALGALVGDRQQAPPMFSAARHRGRRLYELARQGREVTREPRAVTVHSLELVRFTPGEHATATFDVTCSKGTYVRVLCAELGELLGCGACLSFLLRTRAGAQRLVDSWSLDELAEPGALARAVQTPAAAVGHLPAVDLTPSQRRWASFGRPVRVQPSPAVDALPDGGIVAAVGPDGELVCIARFERTDGRPRVVPRKVFVSAETAGAPPRA